MKATHPNKFYNRCVRYLGPFVHLVRPIKVIGRENMAEGAVLICANHSAMIDPIFIGLSYDINTHIHVFAKEELFSVPIISTMLRKLEMIPVDRNTADVNAIKTAMKILKEGEKVVIFPEGTRLAEHDSKAAKSGAVKLAERTGVPIQPVFVPRKKPIFKRTKIVFGKPYTIEKQKEKRTPEEYAKLSEELMDKIKALEPVG